MPCKTTSGARKKQPVLKAPVPKVLAVTQTPSLAQKAASGMHVASGEENHLPAIGTSAATQDKGMPHFYCRALLTPPTGDSAPEATDTLADLIRDLDPEAAAKVVALRGEYSTRFMHALLIFFFSFIS